MRHWTLAAVASTAALLAAGPAAAQERVAIGTGGTGGVFYVVGAGMADVLNSHLDGVTATAEVTGASVENVRRVHAGEMLLGFSSASTLFDGAEGNDPFEEPQAVAAIAYLYPATLQVAAAAGSGIESIDDLADARVGIGPPGSNSSVLAERLLAAYDAFDMGNVQFLSYNEATGAIQDGNLDATFVLAGVPAAALIELATTTDIVFLPVDPDRVAGMLEEYPYYQLGMIPGGIYEGQEEDVAAVDDPAILFTSADADEELVYRITSTLFGHLDQLAEVHPMAGVIAADTAPRTPIPLHPGAQRFFDER